MNRETIIQMALEAGVKDNGIATRWFEEWGVMERFAAAIRSATKEEDARICEDSQDRGPDNGCCPTYWNESLEYAIKAIRASK